VLGADQGSLVIVQDAQTRSELFRFEAFPGFSGGVNVAAGDVNGDDVPDIIVAADISLGCIIGDQFVQHRTLPGPARVSDRAINSSNEELLRLRNHLWKGE